MNEVKSVDQFNTYVTAARKAHGRLETNCYLFGSAVERLIQLQRLYYVPLTCGCLFFVDEECFFTTYYYAANGQEIFDDASWPLDVGKPILVRNIGRRDVKSESQQDIDTALMRAGFSLADRTAQVWTDVADNLEKRLRIYDRTEQMLPSYGLRLVSSDETLLDGALELLHATPEIKMYHVPYETREEQFAAAKEGRLACIVNENDEVCAARRIDITGEDLYSPWFCVRENYRDKYGLGIIMTGFEMKYAQAHGLKRVYGWIAEDNDGSWRYHKRMGVNIGDKVAEEWILEK